MEVEVGHVDAELLGEGYEERGRVVPSHAEVFLKARRREDLGWRYPGRFGHECSDPIDEVLGFAHPHGLHLMLKDSRRLGRAEEVQVLGELAD